MRYYCQNWVEELQDDYSKKKKTMKALFLKFAKICNFEIALRGKDEKILITRKTKKPPPKNEGKIEFL